MERRLGVVTLLYQVQDANFTKGVVWVALWFGPEGDKHFGLGVGTLVLLINVVLLSGYTLGCHSFRHLVGGKLDCYSCDGIDRHRYGFWSRVTMLRIAS